MSGVDEFSGTELKNAVRAAARWYAVLQSPSVSEQDKRAWRDWLEQTPSHYQAWREVEQIQAGLAQLPGDISLATLRGAACSRRDLLRRLGIIAVIAPVGVGTWHLAPWQEWRAQYATATGEQREVTLADGGTLVLNTATSVDIDFSADSRLIRLYRGEILVQTAPDRDAPTRPFMVETSHGRVQALGTRFMVRMDHDQTTVTVLEKAVRIHPAARDEQRDIGQNQQLGFSARTFHPMNPADASAGSWLHGSLVVVDMPLRQLLAELSRYRRGLLSCSDDIANLKISGAFPLNNTDRALTAIVRAFPVRETRLTRFLVRLTPI